MKSRHQRRVEAQQRQEAYSKLSFKEKLERALKAPGNCKRQLDKFRGGK